MLPKGIFSRCLALAGLSLLAVGVAQATPATSPVGSSNVTVADPTVPRPPGKPCVVQLFSNDTFNDYSPRPFSYTPPAGCGTHWSKVVLEADFSVTAGIQYDRTANLWLGGVNLYFGTTEEPSPNVSPSWHVERDLTDYSALFRTAGNGQALLGNTVNSTYTGVISGSARLLFYPANALAPAAQVPDAVYPLGSDPIGSTTELDTSTSQLSKTLTLPRNVERAYLDVFTQSQNADEFWYTCVPDQFAAEVEECGGGNFREAEISIDGQPAGVAPVYPWIFTGGIDPYLWSSTPGVQTLNFMPYRVDLTPFAGVLSNGSPHQVAVNVQGADDYFMATATLLVYQDAQSKQVTGQLTGNTLVNQAPTPTISNTLNQDASGNVTGNINTQLSRHFVIEGFVNTSHGRVDTTVDQTVGFNDTQGFNITATAYGQNSDQVTSVSGSSRSRVGPLVTGEFSQTYSYPLHVDVLETFADDGSLTLASTVDQAYNQQSKYSIDGFTVYGSSVSNHVTSGDTEDVNASFELTGHSGAQSTQSFQFNDSLGGCYSSSVASANNVITAYSSGDRCPAHRNRVFWFSHPDGSPFNGGSVLGW